jgi:putative DNA primase/helicase
MYSTHKHDPKSPRLRLILPLDRKVTPGEYMAISRKIAGTLGINFFDHTTFQPERLMYWPSTSKDGVFVSEYQDGDWLNADEILNSYHDWKDTSAWPVSDREKDIVKKGIAKQGDPLEKPGVVGAWCRTYSISEAIELFFRRV